MEAMSVNRELYANNHVAKKISEEKHTQQRVRKTEVVEEGKKCTYGSKQK